MHLSVFSAAQAVAQDTRIAVSLAVVKVHHPLEVGLEGRLEVLGRLVETPPSTGFGLLQLPGQFLRSEGRGTVESDVVNLDAVPLFNGNAQTGAIGKQCVWLLLHGNGHIQKALLHVMIADAFGRHRKDIVVQDPAGQQIDFPLHRLLLRSVHPGDAVACQPRELSDPNHQVHVSLPYFRHFQLDVCEQILCPQPSDGTSQSLPGNVDFLAHLQRTEQLDGLHICMLRPQNRQPGNSVVGGQSQVNEVLLCDGVGRGPGPTHGAQHPKFQRLHEVFVG